MGHKSLAIGRTDSYDRLFALSKENHRSLLQEFRRHQAPAALRAGHRALPFGRQENRPALETRRGQPQEARVSRVANRPPAHQARSRNAGGNSRRARRATSRETLTARPARMGNGTMLANATPVHPGAVNPSVRG